MSVTYRETSTGRSSFSKVLVKWRLRELSLLLIVSLLIFLGLGLLYQAKTTRPLYDSKKTTDENISAVLADDPDKVVFSTYLEMIEQKKIVDLSRVRKAEEIMPPLSSIANEKERYFVADEIFKAIKGRKTLNSVGELSSSNVTRTRREIRENADLEQLRQYVGKIRQQETRNIDSEAAPDDGDRTVNILRPFSPLLRLNTVVRSPADFNRSLLISIALFFASFFAIHIVWSIAGMRSNQVLLPVIQILCGLGFITMISIHDPLRDSLMFSEFATGIVFGALLLLIGSFAERLFQWPFFARGVRYLGIPSGNFMQSLDGWRKYLILLAAFLLSVLLLTLGKGPAGTKVNLGPFQPSEFIKLLVVLFLAAYFAGTGIFLESIRSRWMTFIRIPRLRDLIPVFAAIAAVFILFNLQRDLGPALILILLFLLLYSTARKNFALAGIGLITFAGLLALNYYFAYPPTVFSRIRIFLNVWENGLPNGDQIARGWWALSSGGFWGTGLGLGDPSESTIPAGHTDLILASIGEELGFIGVAAIILLYLVLFVKGLQIAISARRDSAFFLALGLTLLLGLEIILIMAGVLGLFPLTGVVNPFLSYGKSSMIANFIIIGLLAAISDDSPDAKPREGFLMPIRIISTAFLVIFAVILTQAFRIQYWNGDENVAKAILTLQGDGEYRYVYNTRLEEVAKLLPKGTIFDRNGIPLATSDCSLIEAQKSTLASIGSPIVEECSGKERNYPFYRGSGLSLFHILGDSRLVLTERTANGFLEKTERLTLQGFDDKPKELSPEEKIRKVEEHNKETGWSTRELEVQPRNLSELVPLLRHRHFTWQPELRAMWNKKRDIHTTIDIRLQLALAAIVERKAKEARLEKAAAVVVDPGSGDILAMVSYPWFTEEQLKEFAGHPPNLKELSETTTIQLQDRARSEPNFPGSTFKIVAAIAALKNHPGIAEKTYQCVPLENGRVGIAKVPGYGRVRDAKDDPPHDPVNLSKGIVESCNAYFAQLAVLDLKEKELWDISQSMGLHFAKNPISKFYTESGLVEINNQTAMHDHLPQAGFGQYPVTATPLQMSQVAATIANGGTMVTGHLLKDTGSEPVILIDRDSADLIGRAMRDVVTTGTAKSLAGLAIPMAGKTGTAEVQNMNSHSWFIGYAPYRGMRPLAFALFFENGGSGAKVAGTAAGDLVIEASRLGLFE